MALVAASVVATTVGLLAVMLDGRRTVAAYDQRGVMLSELADAVLAETLAELAADPAFSGVPERTFGGGSIRSSVAVTPTGLRLVTGVGSASGWRCIVTAEVEVAGGPRVLRVVRRHLPPGSSGASSWRPARSPRRRSAAGHRGR